MTINIFVKELGVPTTVEDIPEWDQEDEWDSCQEWPPKPWMVDHIQQSLSPLLHLHKSPFIRFYIGGDYGRERFLFILQCIRPLVLNLRNKGIRFAVENDLLFLVILRLCLEDLILTHPNSWACNFRTPRPAIVSFRAQRFRLATNSP
jgi:hypothetical protein